MFPTGRQRILRATAATLSWQPLDSDGEVATSSPGTVTVGVVSSDGTTVIAAGTATTGSGGDAREVALTAADTAELDVLTATWKVGSTTVATTYHDIVGGFYCTTTDIRGREPSLADGSRDTATSIVVVRNEIECTIESACGGAAFVPRFSTCTRDQALDAMVMLPVPWLRVVRWVRVWSDNETYAALTAAECAAIPASEAGIVRLPYSVTGRVEIGYEHGMDAPPLDLRRAAITAIRSGQHASRSGILDRATSMQMPDGGSVTLATPGVGRWHTGIPVMDEVVRLYDRTTRGVG